MKPSLALALTLLAALAAGCGGTEEAVPGGACGGRGGAACPADQYCDFGGNRCGADDMPGTCRPRPASCPVLLVPERVCGCDGAVHPSLCDANLAGADANAAGTCTLEPGAFACGYRQCTRSSQYCVRSTSDVGGEPDAFTCSGLPAGCSGTASCACLAGQPCGNLCSGDAASGVTLTCPGG
jgi:hypothetical protein